jgi:hypothetical protein
VKGLILSQAPRAATLICKFQLSVSQSAPKTICVRCLKRMRSVFTLSRRPRKGRREKCDPNGIIYGNSESSCTPPTSTTRSRRSALADIGWPLRRWQWVRACSLQQLHLISLKSSEPASMLRIFYHALVRWRARALVVKMYQSRLPRWRNFALCRLAQAESQPTNSSRPPGCAELGSARLSVHVTVCAKLLLSLQATWK